MPIVLNSWRGCDKPSRPCCSNRPNSTTSISTLWGEFPQPELIKGTLDASLTPEVRVQDLSLLARMMLIAEAPRGGEEELPGFVPNASSVRFSAPTLPFDQPNMLPWNSASTSPAHHPAPTGGDLLCEIGGVRGGMPARGFAFIPEQCGWRLFQYRGSRSNARTITQSDAAVDGFQRLLLVTLGSRERVLLKELPHLLRW